ncbi:MAG TPA: YSC84-related protein, partial [Steroidobacteraceae bacterium]
IALDGTALTINNRANAAFYRKRGVTASDIISGAVSTDEPSAQRFLASVNASVNRTQQAASTPASNTSAPANNPPPPPSQPASGGAQTFPLEDPAPGEEPPR